MADPHWTQYAERYRAMSPETRDQAWASLNEEQRESLLHALPVIEVARRRRRKFWFWFLGIMGALVVIGGLSGGFNQEGTRTERAIERQRTEAPPKPKIELDAAVRFTGTQFVVTNNNIFAWNAVELEVNRSGLFSGGYTADLGMVSPGQTITIGALQLANSDGVRFNPWQMKPQRATVKATVNGERIYYSAGW